MTDAQTPEAAELLISAPKDSRLKKILKRLGWTGFGIVCLVLFTFLKLPEIRMKNYVQGTLSGILGEWGITYTAGETYFSFWRGPRLILEDVVVNLPPPDAPVKFAEMIVAPSVIPLFMGRVGATISAESTAGTLKATIAVPVMQAVGASSGKGVQDFDIGIKFSRLNLGKLGVLPVVAKLRGGLIVDGAVDFNGNPLVPQTWKSDGKLSLTQINLEAQTIYGFNLPPIRVGEGLIQWEASNGKATLKEVKLGKAGASDDITAQVSGDITLARSLPESALKLKSRLTLSTSVLKSLSILDLILGPGKQTDGSYAFSITGTVGTPLPAPLGAGQ